MSTNTLTLNPEIAVKLGLNEAIIINQINFWLIKHERDQINFHDGKYWVYNSFEAWLEQFPFMKLRSLKSYFKNLEQQGILLTGNYNKLAVDRTKWYSLDYTKLFEVTGVQLRELPELNQTHSADIASSIVQNLHDAKGQICTTNTREYYTDNTTDNISDLRQCNLHSDLRQCNLPSNDGEESAPACVTVNKSNIVNNTKGEHKTNYAILDNQIKTVGKELDFTEEEIEYCQKFIRKYFAVYRKRTGHDHPALNSSTLGDVMLAICPEDIDVDLFDYEYLITSHFKTKYAKDIDWNIVHFASRKVLGTLMTNNGLIVT